MLKLKVIHAMNKLLIIIVIGLITACSNQKEKSVEEISLLNVYFNDLRKNSRQDSIFLGLDNSNSEIFKTYKRLIKNESVKKDSLISKILSVEEFENFEKQTLEGTWDIDLSKFDKVVYQTDYMKGNKILYVTKPIFSIDKKRALIYSFNKESNKVYFIPSIEVYNKINNKWKKTSIIKHF